jgi:hypothetical protein
MEASTLRMTNAETSGNRETRICHPAKVRASPNRFAGRGWDIDAYAICRLHCPDPGQEEGNGHVGMLALGGRLSTTAAPTRLAVVSCQKQATPEPAVPCPPQRPRSAEQ